MKKGFRLQVSCLVVVLLLHVVALKAFEAIPSKISQGANALFFEVVGLRVIEESHAAEPVKVEKEKVTPSTPKKLEKKVKAPVKEKVEKPRTEEKETSAEKKADDSERKLSSAPDLLQGTAEERPAVAARPVYAPRPVFPEEERRRAREGEVKLALLVSKEGRVLEVRIRKTSGIPAFDEAAERAGMRWRFTPAKDKAGNALERWCVVLIRFELNR